MGEYNKKRIVWLDYLRVFAILSIVLLHVQDINYFPQVPSISFVEDVFLHFSNILGNIGVPLFLILTGYLFLDRVFTKGTTIKFYKRNFIGLLITTEIWFLFLYLVFWLWGAHSFELNNLIKILMLSTDADIRFCSYLWYLPMIIRIYFFIPLMAIILAKIPQKIFYIIFTIFACYVFLPTTLTILNFPFQNEFFSHFRFLNDVYLVYVLLGYTVKKGIFDKLTPRFLMIGLFVSVIGALYIVHIIKNSGYHIFFLLSITLFFTLLVKKFSPSKIGNLSFKISENSFAIYLVHIPVLWTIFFVLHFPYIEPIFCHVAIYYPIIFTVSFCLVEFIKKFKTPAKYFLYIR